MNVTYYNSMKLEITDREAEQLTEEFRILRLNSSWYRDRYTDSGKLLERVEKMLTDYAKGVSNES